MIDKAHQRLRLTLRQVETFVATARAGSTRAAAEHVARSQSAASNAIAELESSLGAKLFDRVGRRLVLNDNGRLLLPQAIALLEKGREVEALFVPGQVAALHVVSSFTIGEYLLPGLLAQWRQRVGGAQVKLDISNTASVLQAVASFNADLGFIEGTHTHPGLRIERWCDDEMLVVAAPGHECVKGRPTRAQLSRQAWIMREAGSGTREAADRFLVPALGHLDICLELGSNEAVKRAVAAGLGLGCLSRHAVADALRHGWLSEVRAALPRMRRSLSIVRHRERPLGQAARSFVQHSREWVRVPKDVA